MLSVVGSVDTVLTVSQCRRSQAVPRLLTQKGNESGGLIEHSCSSFMFAGKSGIAFCYLIVGALRKDSLTERFL